MNENILNLQKFGVFFQLHMYNNLNSNVHVVGLLGLVSSSMVIAKYDTSLLGWSFFLTVAAIAIVLLQVHV